MIKTTGHIDMIVNRRSLQFMSWCWKLASLPPLQLAATSVDGNLVNVRRGSVAKGKNDIQCFFLQAILASVCLMPDDRIQMTVVKEIFDIFPGTNLKHDMIVFRYFRPSDNCDIFNKMSFQH